MRGKIYKNFFQGMLFKKIFTEDFYIYKDTFNKKIDLETALPDILNEKKGELINENNENSINKENETIIFSELKKIFKIKATISKFEEESSHIINSKDFSSSSKSNNESSNVSNNKTEKKNIINMSNLILLLVM